MLLPLLVRHSLQCQAYTRTAFSFNTLNPKNKFDIHIKMPHAKSKNKVGLGNSLMNDRFGKGSRTSQHRSSHGITRVAQDGTEYKINEKEEDAWMKMRSITEQGDLEEFLSNAELAGTDFTAERINGTKILHVDQKNPYLLSANEERAVSRKHNENKAALTVPRRPPWSDSTTPQQLDEMERESLVDWRRGLAELQENKDLLMTPFERNIEVWRQLWRVCERSDLIVQIVDARNPLLYRSEDLELYVKEIDSDKENLLLVNKADMLTLEQREIWAQYFQKHNIQYRFFSARLAREIPDSPVEEQEESIEDLLLSRSSEAAEGPFGAQLEKTKVSQEASDGENNDASPSAQSDWTDDERVASNDRSSTRIMTVDELEGLFLQSAPDLTRENNDEAGPHKITIGLVGYPNVGKSSTINALVGAKKVSVSATPGKTKHFQTIHLSDKVILCDCPGLVFPNFASTKAELVVNGILPIDQQREFTGPAGLVAQRIPKAFFEALYGVKVRTRPVEEGGSDMPTADEILSAYARIRGFSAQNKSGWDTSRAARVVLKDYVNGKLLWCKPPPTDPPLDEKQFNRQLDDRAQLPLRRQARAASDAAQKCDIINADTDLSRTITNSVTPITGGSKSQQLDRKFFAAQRGNAGHISMPFNYKYSDQGKQLSGRKAKVLMSLEKGVDPTELDSSKKHFKGNRKLKQRKVGQTAEYD